MMRVVCAWCGKELKEGPPGTAHDEPETSHGICPTCAGFIESSGGGSSLERFLDGLGKPVLIVDADANVLFANALALDMLGKDLPQVRGFKGGDVFECAYARLPGGCGNTVHCKACAIRRTVERTFDSGKPAHGVPATLQRSNGQGESEVGLLISTEMVGGMVLLRIDDVDRPAQASADS